MFCLYSIGINMFSSHEHSEVQIKLKKIPKKTSRAIFSYTHILMDKICFLSHSRIFQSNREVTLLTKNCRFRPIVGNWFWFLNQNIISMFISKSENDTMLSAHCICLYRAIPAITMFTWSNQKTAPFSNP